MDQGWEIRLLERTREAFVLHAGSPGKPLGSHGGSAAELVLRLALWCRRYSAGGTGIALLPDVETRGQLRPCNAGRRSLLRHLEQRALPKRAERVFGRHERRKSG